MRSMEIGDATTYRKRNLQEQFVARLRVSPDRILERGWRIGELHADGVLRSVRDDGAMTAKRLAHELLDLDAGPERLPHSLQLAEHFLRLDRVLSEQRARLLFAFPGDLPI